MKHACDLALAEAIPLATGVLARDPSVAARLDRAAIERLIDPPPDIWGAPTRSSITSRGTLALA